MSPRHPLSGPTRRNFAMGAAGLAATLTVARPSLVRALGLTKVKLTQPTDSLSFMPIYVAKQKSFFQEEGLDVETIFTRGDGPDVQALMAKEVEFVATPPQHLFTLFLQGRKLVGVCGLLGRCVINLVISKEAAAQNQVDESSPFEKKLASVKGLTIGTSAPGSLTYNVAEYYILRAGLKSQADARVVATGTGAAAIAAMRNKIVNAYSFSSPLTDQLVKGGEAVWLINNARAQDPLLKNFLHAVIYVRPDYLKDNEDVVRRMLRALSKASQFIHATSVEDLAKLLRPNFSSLDEQVYLSALANVREAVTPDGRMAPEGAESLQKMLLDTGHLKQAVAFDSVFSNAYLPK